MIRCKDSQKSLDFYQKVMGMTLLDTFESKAAKFTNYFLGYKTPYELPPESNPYSKTHREGLLELTWNHGTESDANFSYHDSNKDPQGFGHICMFQIELLLLPRLARLTDNTGMSVDDLDAACARFEEQKVNWKKRLTDGRMKHIAFVLDPDGYWVEIIQNHTLKA